MEQLIALLIFGAVAFLNWLLKRQQDQGSQDTKPSEPLFPAPRRPTRQSSQEESEEERVRKFMEALGLPSGATPPQPPQRRPIQRRPPPTAPVQPRTVSARQSRPVSGPAPAEVRPQFAPPLVQEPPAPQYEVSMTTEAPAPAPTSAPVPAALATPQPAPQQPVPAENLAISLLKKPESLRTAFILREILGPPRSLQAEFRESLQ